MQARFGDCLFDTEARQLTRAGRVVELTPKGFELLATLLAGRPRALSKQELHEALWPDTFVVDVSLARLVSEVRKAIGDTVAEQRFIRTVHGHGYAFSGDVQELGGRRSGESPAPCWLVWGRRMVPLDMGENLIGRAAESVLAIDSSKVSRHHARVEVSETGARLEDLGSKNGTYIGGKRLEGGVVLKDGDQITVGPVVAVFRTADGAASTETELTAMEPPVIGPERG